METIKNHALKIYASVLAVLISVLAYAQEKLDVDVNIGEQQTWYANPVVWVIGAAVFILILVALLRSGGKGD